MHFRAFWSLQPALRAFSGPAQRAPNASATPFRLRCDCASLCEGQAHQRKVASCGVPVPAAEPIEAAAAKVASPKPEKRRSKLQEMWGDELEKLRD